MKEIKRQRETERGREIKREREKETETGRGIRRLRERAISYFLENKAGEVGAEIRNPEGAQLLISFGNWTLYLYSLDLCFLNCKIKIKYLTQRMLIYVKHL